MWKNNTTGQKVDSVSASLPPASEPAAHGTFPLTLIRGWILLQEIVYNHVLFTCSTSLTSPRTEPGWEEASVNACRIEVTA